jgi:hypothetical protein
MSPEFNPSLRRQNEDLQRIARPGAYGGARPSF